MRSLVRTSALALLRAHCGCRGDGRGSAVASDRRRQGRQPRGRPHAAQAAGGAQRHRARWHDGAALGGARRRSRDWCGCCCARAPTPRAATREGITPLQLAAVNGSVATTEALLEAGANPNAVLPEGETVLMTAARTGKPACSKILLDRGADLKAREKWYGETALMWAAAENHADAVQTAASSAAPT